MNQPVRKTRGKQKNQKIPFVHAQVEKMYREMVVDKGETDRNYLLYARTKIADTFNLHRTTVQRIINKMPR